jgi:hypothetical protein
MANPHRRDVLTRGWLVAVLGWSVFRSMVVAHTLRRYGVNPWAYGTVDLVSSWPYAVASAGVVTSLLDRRMAAFRRNGLVAAAAFFFPDLYLLLAGHHKPRLVYLVVVGVALVFATAALVSTAMQVRAGRRDRVVVAAA